MGCATKNQQTHFSPVQTAFFDGLPHQCGTNSLLFRQCFLMVPLRLRESLFLFSQTTALSRPMHLSCRAKAPFNVPVFQKAIVQPLSQPATPTPFFLFRTQCLFLREKSPLATAPQKNHPSKNPTDGVLTEKKCRSAENNAPYLPAFSPKASLKAGTDAFPGFLQQPEYPGKTKGPAACNLQTANPFRLPEQCFSGAVY